MLCEHHLHLHQLLLLFYDILIFLQYVDDFNSTVLAFANSIYNPNGGTHVTGFKTALTRTINSYEKEKNITKEKEVFSGDDVIEGITAVITIAMPEIQFKGKQRRN